MPHYYILASVFRFWRNNTEILNQSVLMTLCFQNVRSYLQISQVRIVYFWDGGKVNRPTQACAATDKAQRTSIITAVSGERSSQGRRVERMLMRRFLDHCFGPTTDECR